MVLSTHLATHRTNLTLSARRPAQTSSAQHPRNGQSLLEGVAVRAHTAATRRESSEHAVSGGLSVLSSSEALELQERPVSQVLGEVTADAAASTSGRGSEARWWDWKYSARVHYVRAGSKGLPLLLLHGFGVGSYHFADLIDRLSLNHRVWAMDLLGQGQSWPQREVCSEEGLCYSVDTWTEQVADFIQQVVGEPVYLAGNSLGGYLAASVAAQHGGLCRGVVFLNATPFWAFAPRLEANSALARLLPWNGVVPAPEWTRQVIGRLWWDRLRTKGTIKGLLSLVYSDVQRADDDLVQRILQATEHPQALDALASILFSPKSRLSFNEMVAALACPVCLIYGRQDPWVVPLWGQRLKRQLPQAAYFELSPAGHCPMHEQPSAVHWALSGWLNEVDCQSGPVLPVGEQWAVEEVTITHVDGSPRNVFERVDAAIHRCVSWLKRVALGRSQQAQS